MFFAKTCLQLLSARSMNYCSRSLSTTDIVYSNGSSEDSSKMLLTKKSSKFRVLCADSKGKRSSYEVSKSTLFHDLGLTVRDLRFQHTNMLAIRNKKIIVRFQNLKAIICSDAVLLIDPPFESENFKSASGDVAEFWRILPHLITGSSLYTSSLPLEYRGLEAVFTHTLFNLTKTLSEFEPSINKLLEVLTDPVNLIVDRSLVHILLKNSARLNTFSTVVQGFCDTLDEILEYDEDVRDLCISIDVEGENRALYDAFIFNPYTSTAEGQDNDERGSEDHTRRFDARFPRTVHRKYKINMKDEMEVLLDTFIRDAEDISNRVGELKKAIDNSNTAILINLDSHRNLLLRKELQLTMGMFSCTLFGMIGIAYGMNLDSALEENPFAFWVATGIMFLGTGIYWKYLLKSIKLPNETSSLLKQISSKHNETTPPPKGGNGEDLSSKIEDPLKQDKAFKKIVSTISHGISRGQNSSSNFVKDSNATDNSYSLFMSQSARDDHRIPNKVTSSSESLANRVNDTGGHETVNSQNELSKPDVTGAVRHRMKPLGVAPSGFLSVSDLLKESTKRRNIWS